MSEINTPDDDETRRTTGDDMPGGDVRPAANTGTTIALGIGCGAALALAVAFWVVALSAGFEVVADAPTIAIAVQTLALLAALILLPWMARSGKLVPWFLVTVGVVALMFGLCVVAI